MILDSAARFDSPIHRIDPRVRILLAVAFSVYPLLLTHADVLTAAVGLAFVLCVTARMPDGTLLKRLLAVNAFMLLLILLLPWGVPGTPILQVGPLTYSEAGFQEAWRIALRGNAIVLALTAFIGTLEPVTFGHALERLRAPRKLVQVLLFTVRYIAVFEQEYGELRRAMIMRGFRPQFDRHTLRSFGHLVGMLLVRALDRSERIQAAMRCRAFAGVFHCAHLFHLRFMDAFVAAGLTSLMALLVWADKA